jgi:hypothetical protein
MIPFALVGRLVNSPLVKIGAFVLAAVGLFGFGYYKGGEHTTDKYEAQIAKARVEEERRYNELLAKKNKVDIQVVTEYVEKVVEVTKWRTKNVEVIKYVPDTGVLSSGWVHVHDASAKAVHANSTSAADATPSEFTAAEALGGVVDNYATCKKTTEQLIALQNWIRAQENAINER